MEEVALVADIDSMDDSEDRVVLMTLHSAKGLEFPKVYLTGMEEGLFPSMMAMSEDPEAVEEERRLCYVGITRAEKELMLTAARQRMINGDTRYEKPSRFLQEVPEEYLEREEQENSIYTRRRVQNDFDDSDLPWGNRSEGISLFGKKTNSYGVSDRDTGNTWSSFGSGFGAGKSAYATKQAKTAPEKPAFGKAFTVQKASALDYGPGDRVRHMRFGEGTVKNVADGGKDFEVTVEFDKMGVRKMFASFAKLQKI